MHACCYQLQLGDMKHDLGELSSSIDRAAARTYTCICLPIHAFTRGSNSVQQGWDYMNELCCNTFIGRTYVRTSMVRILSYEQNFGLRLQFAVKVEAGTKLDRTLPSCYMVGSQLHRCMHATRFQLRKLLLLHEWKGGK